MARSQPPAHALRLFESGQVLELRTRKHQVGGDRQQNRFGSLSRCGMWCVGPRCPSNSTTSARPVCVAEPESQRGAVLQDLRQGDVDAGPCARPTVRPRSCGSRRANARFFLGAGGADQGSTRSGSVGVAFGPDAHHWPPASSARCKLRRARQACAFSYASHSVGCLHGTKLALSRCSSSAEI
jgi:hypothetical protein